MNGAELVATYIGEKLGLIPQDRWVPALLRAEPDLIRRHGRSLDELSESIARDADLFLELAGLLSVGETYFLRHGGHFDLVVDAVRRRLAELPPGRKVVVWSAGCSSGEEPYSVAIAIHAQLGQEALDRVEIIGTDVDARAIAKAESARFTAWSFRGTPPWLLPTYFSREEGAYATLSHPGVRRAVRFERMPLAARVAGFSAESLDLVLFRNVAIYLLDDARIALQREMRRALRPGGLLVQGPSDPPPPVDAFQTVPSDTTYCCYVSTSGSSTNASSASRASSTATRTTRPPALPPRPRPARPAAAVVSSKPSVSTPRPRVNTPVPPAEDVDAALGIAERGDVAEAMSRLGVAVDPADAVARLLRGKVFLAARRLPEAIEELRASVFLDPGPILPRYWYASALHAARKDRQASAQLRELERRIERLGASTLVEDGETTRDELLGSVRLLLEAYE